MRRFRTVYIVVITFFCMATVAACSVGSNDPIGTIAATNSNNEATPTPPSPTPSPSPEPAPTPAEASRFLMSASFGPKSDSIDTLVDLGYSKWMEEQLQMPIRSILEASAANMTPGRDHASEGELVISQFYENAILGEDQLRMRATFALSQVFVVSTRNSRIGTDGEALARYVDILQEGAFGNFRDILEEVTYSPVMGEYLTFAGNRKANPITGSAPDENFAREIMQLFTIGLYELNTDGTQRLDEFGEPIETYSNDDITELAKVFTGLWFDGLPFGRQRKQRTYENQTSRMVMFDDEHAKESKTFLGETIPATYSGDESITAALDILFEHPNVAPFISSQLIQRLTTSNPSPGYVQRVADTFNRGAYTLPSGAIVGEGIRGDMRAVWTAILLDSEFLDLDSRSDPNFGKIREPVLLFTHWARMSGAPAVNLVVGDTVVDGFVLNQQQSSRLGQRPFTSSSVFNFYRPGYVAAGSHTAEAGLVAPELQIATTSSLISYANFMRALVFRNEDAKGTNGVVGLIGNYAPEIEVAHNTTALINRLDILLTAGAMTDGTRRRLERTIESVSFDNSNSESRLRNRVQLAIQLLMVSPEYMVQQ